MVELSLVMFEITMDSFSSLQRAYGHPVEPMITSLLGACGFRILWLSTVFRMYPVYEIIIASWPISWFITTIVHFFVARKILRKYPKEDVKL